MTNGLFCLVLVLPTAYTKRFGVTKLTRRKKLESIIRQDVNSVDPDPAPRSIWLGLVYLDVRH